MIDGSTVYAISKKVSFQKLGEGEGAVVLTLDTGQLHTCNDTTAAFLGLLDGQRTLDMIVNCMETNFDVSKVELRSDLEELVGQLVDEGLIT